MIDPQAMSDSVSEDRLNLLRSQLRQFVAERDWHKFHTPKNLATALSVEAAELLEPFQWLATGEGDETTAAQRLAIRHEVADVFTYLILLADRLDIDLIEAATKKMALNAIKYPVELVRGDARKYSDY